MTCHFSCRGAFRYIRLLSLVYYYQKCNLTVPQAFARTVKKNQDKPALIFEDQTWTFKQLEDYSNRVANYFLRAGYKPGQCVALFMENRLEYVGIWLGCSKVGLVPALINANLSGHPLVHSIRAASAKLLIYGSEFHEGNAKDLKVKCVQIISVTHYDRGAASLVPGVLVHPQFSKIVT